ncbi:MAG TPA: O-antigen ligase family protein [Candidatus Omnitrophota bacterium]|nr:O-antigen ligase family protein [Candidatus Omnitrophota bacterium]HPS19559.1 O-antigen ligase family protein [Candidatus Omnitrophota bacterium]
MDKNRIISGCDHAIEWGFYVLIVAAAFSTSLVELSAGVVMLGWIFKKLLKFRFDEFKIPAFFFLGAFVLWSLLSCFDSSYPKESFRGVCKVLEYALLFMSVALALENKKVCGRFANIMLVAVFIVCVDGFYQYFAGTDFLRGRELIHDDYMRRVSASLIHPNDFGAYLVVVCMILVSTILSNWKNIKYRVVAAVVLAMALLNLFLTQSRAAWLSFAVAMLCYGWVHVRKRFVVFIIAIVGILIFMPQTAKDRMVNTMNFKLGTPSWERLKLWQATVSMIKDRPVLGMGVNTYSRNFPKYRPADYPDVRYAHNSYLQIASEVGIPGVLLFLAFLVSAFYSAFKRSDLFSGYRTDISYGLLWGLVGFAIASMFDTHMQSVSLVAFFHALLGYCFSLNRRKDVK